MKTTPEEYPTLKDALNRPRPQVRSNPAFTGFVLLAVVPLGLITYFVAMSWGLLV